MERTRDGPAIACTLQEAELQRRRSELLEKVFARAQESRPPADGPVWLELTGPEGTKSFLESILGLGEAS